VMEDDEIHILGKAKWIVFCLLSWASFYVLAKYLVNPEYGPINIQMLVIAAGAMGASYLMITESSLKTGLAALICFIMFKISHFIISEAFLQVADERADLALTVVLVVVYVFVWSYLRKYLDNTSWIGVRCPNCSVRGGIEQEELERRYIGSVYRNNRKSNRLRVKYKNTCGECGHSWTKVKTVEDTPFFQN
jgi:hypothetical protein